MIKIDIAEESTPLGLNGYQYLLWLPLFSIPKLLLNKYLVKGKWHYYKLSGLVTETSFD